MSMLFIRIKIPAYLRWIWFCFMNFCWICSFIVSEIMAFYGSRLWW
jgi:hypothetical protein